MNNIKRFAGILWIILGPLAIFYLIKTASEEIAKKLHCSTGWLKKSFSKVYGVGMFHYLRRHRMQLAKEMLLSGESLKAVAIEVGMKPRNFPKEFKTFFGYTVTALKRGNV